MNESSTLNLLILYLYNETKIAETVIVQQAIDFDEEIAETYQHLIEAKTMIEEDVFLPSADTISCIMSYASLSAAACVTKV